jgi:heme exporter protein CcmD
MIDLTAIGGRYPLFVWGAYGASATAFAWMIIDTWVRARAARRTLERLEREEQG